MGRPRVKVGKKHSGRTEIRATPKRAAAPCVRVRVNCADLFTPTIISSLVDTPVTLQPDETSGPVDLGLTLYVAADGAAGYATDFQCWANMLGGDFWVSAYIQNPGDSTLVSVAVAIAASWELPAVCARAVRGHRRSRTICPRDC